MLLKQQDLGCLALASSLIADEATGTAVVVDPQRDIDQHLHDTTPHGWHIELQHRVGATVCLEAQQITSAMA